MGLLRRIDGGSGGAVEPKPANGRVAETPPPPPGPAARPVQNQAHRDLKSRVKSRLIAELDPSMDLSKTGEVRQQIRTLFERMIEAENFVLTRVERDRLFEEVAADIIGFGPIEPFLLDPSVSEVMINGPDQIYIEQKGKLVLTAIKFDDDDHVRRIIDRIVSPLGRHVDESSPICDARLPDGSRVNIVIPPISLVGPCVTIRKFSKIPLTVDDLVRFGSMTPEVAEFMRACVLARLNIVVSGGTGSGKTTLLTVLSSFIPDDERIVTVEDAAELQLRQDHVVRLEARPPNIEGKGAITI
ncbi:MAG: pilus assembly protein CpaF, partial [Chloroflexota bacterium]|nr:pilus assembly protein CpaF [Chloroflexota bacterium]